LKRYARPSRLVGWATGPRRSSGLPRSGAPSASPSSLSNERTAHRRAMAETRYARSNSCSRAPAPARSSSPWAGPARPTVSRLASPPDAIVLPLGTGGTAAGLALAVTALGWPTRVVGVRVAPRIVANRWRAVWLARGAARLLARHDIRLPHPASRLPLVVVD